MIHHLSRLFIPDLMGHPLKGLHSKLKIPGGLFRHRRKTLLSCSKLARGKLAKIADWPELFDKCSICPTKRPETLSHEDYIAIANYAGNSLFLY